MGERGEGRGGGEEAACQIAFADQIIVNKVDRLGRRGPPPDHDHGDDDECDANNGGGDMGEDFCLAAAAMATVESVM